MWFILTGLIFSLSLAGYILLVLGFIIYMFYRGKIGGKYLLLILLLFLVIYSFGMYYNGGDNIVYEKSFHVWNMIRIRGLLETIVSLD